MTTSGDGPARAATTGVRSPVGRRGAAVVDDAAEDVPLLHLREHTCGDASTRERRARALAARLDVPMGVLGVLFLLVVLGQTLATSAALQAVFSAMSWVLWACFVAEFALRLYVSPSRRAFLRRNWWQVVFLLLPVLRFVRLLLVLRLARAGRVVSSAVRSTRSAGRVLSSRLGWLAVVSVIVVLSSSQLLYAFGVYDSYGEALHGAALATITGEPLGRPETFAEVLEVLLATYSVAVFAGLAGAFGAFFLEERRPVADPR